jgi:1-phosphofructokinase
VIVTVTPNPGLDLTYLLEGPSEPGAEVQRAHSVTLEASGKGINVSRVLTLAGCPNVAVLFAGGFTGRHLLELLDAEQVCRRAVRQAGPTRVNTTVLAPGGPSTKVNAPGSTPTAAEIDNLVIAVDHVLVTLSAQNGDASGAEAENWLLICGSVPPQTNPAKLVDRLVTTAHTHGWRCGVDSSGAALAAGFDAGADLLAPNAAELNAVAPGLNATELAARRGCELLVSLGPDGALWTDGRRTVQARGQVVVPVNTAGAGDALLAGWFSVSGGTDDLGHLRHRLATAVAWGTAACLAPTTVALDRPPQGATRQEAPR